MAVPDNLRQAVVERARNRCEYCQLSQFAQEAAFHIDHVLPRAAGGQATLDNLALACVTCSLRKAARLAALDTESGMEVPVFHPRRDDWRTHFRWAGVRIVGLTGTGRGTIQALQMNRPHVLSIREEERHRHRHPPPEDS